MKKQLLTGLALLSVISVYSQNSRVKPAQNGETTIAQKIASKYATINNPNESMPVQGAKPAPIESANSEVTFATPENGGAVASPTVQWKTIGGSMNIYGVLVSASKPLNFNDNLNAVSFIHRKGTSYTTLPFNTNGSIVARVSQNWGATWDSTCIWASDDAIRRARYPQGGIYNPIGGTNLSNAYAVGMGPVTDGTGWKGNWYASKQLGTGNYNATASPAPGAMQFAPNTPPYITGLEKHDFSRVSFASTDDGIVRSMAGRYTGTSGTGQPNGYRGAAIIKGTFNAGTFNWTSDTIIPAVVTTTTGDRVVATEPIMAWNEAGTIGYVVFLGVQATQSVNYSNNPNRSYQPIVYKTTNSGTSWAPIANIDFSTPTMSMVLEHLPVSVNSNTNLVIPFFWYPEGMDAVVDADGALHVVSTIVSAVRNHNDSLGYITSYTFQPNPNNSYNFPHIPNYRPYVYDFTTKGSGWSVQVIDSLSSEGAPTAAADAALALNPWNADVDGNKVGSDSRIQVSRDVSGQYILYSWAESDTAFTQGACKFNIQPNIKVRCLQTSAGSTVTTLSPTEINLTKPSPTVAVTYTLNNNVSSRAWFHYMSPTALFMNCVGSNTIQLKVPFTVSHNYPAMDQLIENRHWFSAATLDFAGLTTCTGFQQSLAYNVVGIEIYPNPANSNATVAVDLKEEGSVNVNVYNTIGMLVKSVSTKGNIGENKMNVDLTNLTSGIYMVKVSVGNTTSTKKLIIQ